ncbi:MAG: hypothetical protein WCR52_21120 [Bacteroidota bacterium]
MKKTMFSLLFSCLALFSAQAQQNRDYDPFSEMQKEIQKFIDQLHSGYSLDMSPGKDTTFYFKWDTTLQGNGNGQFFFRFNPPNMGFQDDSLGFHDMFKDMDAWSKRMNEQYFNHGHNQGPADDGAAPDTGDGLLPEERLRKQDELKEKGGEKEDVKPAPAKPKVKTIRI